MLLVMIPVGMVMGLIIASVYLYLVPAVYESEAIIQFKISSSPQIKQTTQPAEEAEHIMSAALDSFKNRAVLSKVNQQLKLEELWGVDEEAVLKKLKNNVKVEAIRGTDLISVRVSANSSFEARDIARKLLKANVDWRMEVDNQATEAKLSDLRKVCQKQEDRVEECRKILQTLTVSKDSHSPVETNEYVEAKRNFETELYLFEQLKTKLMSEMIEHSIITTVVHDAPEASNKPFAPNVKLLLITGMLGGLLVSPLFALPIMAFLNRRRQEMG